MILFPTEVICSFSGLLLLKRNVETYGRQKHDAIIPAERLS
jgi:hypothetical protein